MDTMLNDPAVYPTDEIIFSYIGDNKMLWQRFFYEIKREYSSIEGIWRFYNDGKSWLFRFMLKKKTLCWIGIFGNTFRITFYFGDKAAASIDASGLPESMKENFRNGQYFGKIRAITISVSEDSDIDHALILTGIRVRTA